jgi:hypothetical protein
MMALQPQRGVPYVGYIIQWLPARGEAHDSWTESALEAAEAEAATAEATLRCCWHSRLAACLMISMRSGGTCCVGSRV